MTDLSRAGLLYDSDGTLSPGNLQEHSFIPGLGFTSSAFWTEDYSRISTRADRLRIAAIESADFSAVLGVIAICHQVSKEATALSLAPRQSGAAFVLERSW